MSGARYYARHEGGHRASYAATAEREFGARRTGLAGVAVTRGPALFLMIEERPLAFLVVAVLRALAGRRTVGLLFQPLTTLRRDSLRRRVKYAGLRLLRRLGACRVLAIEPFDAGDGFGAICDGWLYDLQLWDLSAEEAAAVAARRAALLAGEGDGPAAEATRRAEGRRIVVALGRQDGAKGFDRFARLFADGAAIRKRWLFAYGGAVDPRLQPLSAEFAAAGGVAADRRISDAELFDLYAVADLVWSCYAEGYDQASGVLGRAAQLGVPAAVREGSRLHRLCVAEGIPHVALGADAEAPLLAEPPARAAPLLSDTARRRARSLDALRRALWDAS